MPTITPCSWAFARCPKKRRFEALFCEIGIFIPAEIDYNTRNGVLAVDFLPWLVEATFPGIVVGVVMAIFNRRANAKAKQDAEREAVRAQHDLLRTDLLVATASLAYAVAMAIKRGTPNGEIEEGVKKYEKAMESFRKFEREQLIKHTME